MNFAWMLLGIATGIIGTLAALEPRRQRRAATITDLRHRLARAMLRINALSGKRPARTGVCQRPQLPRSPR